MTPFWALYITLLAFFFGACLGSFLNVCIYRIPIGQSVVAPRSHCPKCNKFIAWYDNIPLLSYLVLKAKCRHCGTHISPRYFFVELLTALLFLAVWNRYGVLSAHPQFALVPVYWLALFGLILGTFVDFEHMILPNRVTIGGMVIGLVLSPLVPAMHRTQDGLSALAQSIIGLVVGFGSLFLVAEFGRLLFGRGRVTPESPLALGFVPAEGAEPAMTLGDETIPWEDLFGRSTERWVFTCTSAKLGDRAWEATEIVLGPRTIAVGGESFERARLPELSAQVTHYVYPRDAMGFGDVKLMGALGAFLGWQSIPFILFVSSIIGSLVGIGLILLRHFKWQSRIPFGPYIAIAATIWMLGASDWWIELWRGFGQVFGL